MEPTIAESTRPVVKTHSFNRAIFRHLHEQQLFLVCPLKILKSASTFSPFASLNRNQKNFVTFDFPKDNTQLWLALPELCDIWLATKWVTWLLSKQNCESNMAGVHWTRMITKHVNFGLVWGYQKYFKAGVDNFPPCCYGWIRIWKPSNRKSDRSSCCGRARRRNGALCDVPCWLREGTIKQNLWTCGP